MESQTKHLKPKKILALLRECCSFQRDERMFLQDEKRRQKSLTQKALAEIGANSRDLLDVKKNFGLTEREVTTVISLFKSERNVREGVN